MPKTKDTKRNPKINKAISDLEKQIDQKLNDLKKIREGCACFPFLNVEITRPVVDDVFEEIHNKYKNCNSHLNVIIDSGGGDIDAAYNLAMLFRRVGSDELNFIVPRWAKSAATLLACAGDKILMTPVAELGPLDPQITQFNPLERRFEQFSPLHIESTLDMIRKEYEKGNEKLAQALMERLQFPLTLGSFMKSLDIGKQYLVRLLETRMLSGDKEVNPKEVATRLTSGYANHGFCINIDEAMSIGLKVEELKREELDIVWQIHRFNIKKREIQKETW
ncbi:MAG: hypothetical protein ACFFDN_43575, partial [Candidatus Hodarchaeota archaeon]